MLHTLIHVALGTANSLGLVKGEPLVPPRTAHFLNSGRCVFNCAYCTRARSSTSRDQYLCRVPWPPFEESEVFDSLRERAEKFHRVCLQIVNSEDFLQTALKYLERAHEVCSLPISVEIRTKRMEEIQQLFESGADYVGLPLDVGSARIYPDLRGGDLSEDLGFLLEASGKYRGKIGTHLIVGLGETEKEMVGLMKAILKREIPLGLFAFTPCRGTRMEHNSAPSLSQYRRIQLAQFIISNDLDGDITFDDKGRISSFALEADELARVPSTIFETQGCENCNRPFYNERPVGRPYNYPRGLTDDEFTMELSEILG